MHYGRIMVDVEGVSLNADDKEFIAHPDVGGIILFKRNFIDIPTLCQLVKDLRAIKDNLIIAVDQEGGRVQRFQGEFTRLPALREIGKLWDKKREDGLTAAYNLAWLMATEVMSMGIDFSFAPVLDIDRGLSEVIGSRAFHSSHTAVSEIAKFYIKGLQAAGSIACGKHFPGHGAVMADSHLAIPFDERDMCEIEYDLEPFIKSINNKLDAIMPAHIVFTKYDSKPACFSKYWLQKELRGNFKFEGAILSDDLSMEGASIIGDFPQRATEALEAGCDMVLACNSRENAEKIIDNAKIPQSRESSSRLAKLRCKKSITWNELRESPRWLACREMLNKWFKTNKKCT